MSNTDTNRDLLYYKKDWKYVWFQHIRKNGGTLINRFVFWSTSRIHCKELPFYDSHYMTKANGRQGAKVYHTIDNTSDYRSKINRLKQTLTDKSRLVYTNEFYSFPTIFSKNGPDYSQLFDIWDEMWNDTLLVTIFRDPFFHVISEVVHGYIAKLRFENKMTNYYNSTKCHILLHPNNTHVYHKDNSIKYFNDIILKCIENNIQLTYNNYIQIFNNQQFWNALDIEDNSKLNELNKLIPSNNLNDKNMNLLYDNIKKIIFKFDVIIINEYLQETFVQFVPFNFVSKCYQHWNNVQLIRNETNLFKYQYCINKTIINKYIPNVQPHKQLHRLNMESDKIDIYYSKDLIKLIKSFNIWDDRLYQYATKLALHRSNLIINGYMWHG